MLIPKDDKATLGLLQSFLVFQVSMPQGQALTIELGIMDGTGTRRRVVLSTSFAELKATPLHSQVPILPVVRDGWLNLVLALSEMTPLLFRSSTFRQIDSLIISGACKLRRVFTLKDLATVGEEGEELNLVLPRGLEFPPNVDVCTQLLGATTLSSLAPGLGSSSLPKTGGTAQSLNAGRSILRKPSLVVKVNDGESSDEEGSRGGVLQLNVVGGVAVVAAQPGSPWAQRSIAGADVQLPSSRLARPMVGVGAKLGASDIAAARGTSQMPVAGSGNVGPGYNAGRRAISAQSVLREEEADTDSSSSMLASFNASGGGANANASSSSFSKPNGKQIPAGRNGSNLGPYAQPKSPPYPRSVYSQRAQSGPARMCEEGAGSQPSPLQQPPSSTKGVNGDVSMSPGTPTSAARHGRRSVMAMAAAGRNIPSTIIEAEPLRSSSEDMKAGTTALHASSGKGPSASATSSAAVSSRLAVAGRQTGPAGTAAGAAVMGSAQITQSNSPRKPSMTAFNSATSNGVPNCLEGLLHVNSSLDFSASQFTGSPKQDSSIHAAGVFSNASGMQQQPHVSNVFSLMQSTSIPTNSRDRYSSKKSEECSEKGLVGHVPSSNSIAAVPPAAAANFRTVAPPTSQRPAAPADHASRPRISSEGPVPAASPSNQRRAPGPATSSAAPSPGRRQQPAVQRAPAVHAASPSKQTTGASDATPKSTTTVSPSKVVASAGGSPQKTGTPPRGAARNQRIPAGPASSGAAEAPSATRPPMAAPPGTSKPPVRSTSPYKGSYPSPSRLPGRASPPTLNKRVLGSPSKANRPALVTEEQHQRRLAQHLQEPRKASTNGGATTASEVEEDQTLTAWNGFGVDDDEEVLGSRHFRQPLTRTESPTIAKELVSAVPSSLAPLKTQVGQAQGLKRGSGGNPLLLLDGLGSPSTSLSNISSPPMRRVGAVATHSNYERRNTHDLDDSVLLAEPSTLLAAQPSYSAMGDHQPLQPMEPWRASRVGLVGQGYGSAAGTVQAEEELLSPSMKLQMGRSAPNEGMDAWSSVERMMPPSTSSYSIQQRAFTPPVVPPSKMMQQQRAAAAAAAASEVHQQGPQVLTLGMKAAGEEMVDLVYDPVLNCYCDIKTNKYYELKH
ncbi:hypothetical protein CEUSTIGMA_g4308.t1 [Chlamydomonas eustigma]|uniref:CFA20 domain-containing protein n=1 Tax=Chlamydomonas eustigma TaxID=1157962 RepID=A0A250X1U7_9CHLO|nr:hypothetical protein CEUSTIGMA_g4308.t1 [Chlamydomonas eustigma]|eukprot:GAX76862.1 hypothetical protein CEUSTIGMA_g4308.t1 [Chlamydomonas eustigma]